MHKTPYKQNRQLRALRYLGGKCAVCGETRLEVLEFHHINPATKEFNIGNNFGSSWNRLVKELDKCQLLCEQCHFKETAKEKQELPSNKTYIEVECIKCGIPFDVELKRYNDHIKRGKRGMYCSWPHS